MLQERDCILSIGGSDPSCGAGVQGDLKTICALGGYGLTVLTVVTAQNTGGIFGVQVIGEDIIDAQLRAVFEDFNIKGVKVGLIYSKEIAEVIKGYMSYNDEIPWILDPVLSATVSGERFVKAKGTKELIDYLNTELFPRSSLITPNLKEFCLLTNSKPKDKEGLKEELKSYGEKLGGGVGILLKGGHKLSELREGVGGGIGEGVDEDIGKEVRNSKVKDAYSYEDKYAQDILYKDKEFYYYREARVNAEGTHGTGCGLSSAITYYMSKGLNLSEAISKGKKYITKALKKSYKLGREGGPINHFCIS